MYVISKVILVENHQFYNAHIKIMDKSIINEFDRNEMIISFEKHQFIKDNATFDIEAFSKFMRGKIEDTIHWWRIEKTVNQIPAKVTGLYL